MSSSWEIYEPRSRMAGGYSKYKSKVAVITRQTAREKEGNTARLMLTPTTWSVLGEPDRVVLMSDGNGRAGLKKAEPGTDEWSQSHAVSKTDGKASDAEARQAGHMRQVGCGGFLVSKEVPLNRVFDAHMSGDVLVFVLNRGKKL